MTQDRLPYVLSKVGCDRGNKECLRLDPAAHQIGMHADIGRRFTVQVASRLELVEANLGGFLVRCAFISITSRSDGYVHVIVECLVPERVACAGTQLVVTHLLHNLCAPVDESVQTKNVGVRGLFLKVGVFNAIASVGKAHTRGIRTELLDGLAQGERVARALGHLGAVEHQVAVRSDGTRPELLGE